MHRRFWICFAAFWFVWAICLAFKLSSPSNDVDLEVSARELATPAPAPKPTPPKPAEQPSQDQPVTLTAMQEKLEARAAAEAKTDGVRRQLQFERQAAWSAILETNNAAYQALREQLSTPSSDKIHCTICKFTSYLEFCILCDSTGKCPTCNGSGKDWRGELCPNCLGKGTCYLCTGLKHMPCPFCECGYLSRKTPIPPKQMPVGYELAPSEPAPITKVVALEPETTVAAPAEEPQPQPGPPRPASRTQAQALTDALLVLGLVFGLGFGIWKFVEVHNANFNPWALSQETRANLHSKLRTEESALAEFQEVFKTGVPSLATSTVDLDEADEHNPVREFLASTPARLQALQKVLQKVSATTDVAARLNILEELHQELHDLKGAAGVPELLPFWQMTAAVEGLVQQLTEKSATINPSTLRTVAGGLDVLKALCVPHLPPDLLTQPPIRLLAVDDDVICRRAVSHALKKAFTPPDLAENGPAALTLAKQHTYDVIFLDIQMPEMDGFETCKQIRATAINAKTPVVFVTCMSDFEARTKSVLSGGSDFIGKPFLMFEITVKALTFALQRRLQLHAQATAAISGREPQDLYPAQLPGPDDLVEPSAHDVTRSYLSHAANQLGPLRELVQTIFQTGDEQQRHELLAVFDERFAAFIPKEQTIAGHPVRRLGEAVQALLKKLLERPEDVTSSCLLSLATAVDLLHELCAKRARADLVENPPIQILAVDDDPIARLALKRALQGAFGSPDCAENGQAAFELARQKPYDVVFMDVQMPGMDGFTACFRIHETQINQDTPVVFVTGYTDFKSRSQASISGGCDFMAKPFLTAEITLKALTFALRGRLQKEKTAQYVALLAMQERRAPAYHHAVPA